MSKVVSDKMYDSVFNMFSLKSFLVFLLLSCVVTSENVLKSDQSLLPITTNSTKESALTSQEKHDDIKNVTAVLTGVHSSREGVSNNAIVSEGGMEVALDNTSQSVNKLTSSSPKPSLRPDEGSEVSKSSVHARKGVDIMDIPPLLVNNTLTSQALVTNVNNQTSNIATTSLNTTAVPLNKTDVAYKVTESIASVPEQTPSSSTTDSPHKPTLTISFDEAHPNASLFLEVTNITLRNELQRLHSAKNKDNNSSGSRDQPAFIVPIVITLFAVPMLGLIGYQAVKRGREAWKNRHYRRMDFLIDGMYND